METKIRQYAEQVFKIAGWLSLLGIAGNVVAQAYLHLWAARTLHSFGMVPPFPWLQEIKFTSDSFAYGFLALLIASILQMIRLRKLEWVKQRPYRLALMTTLAFFLQGIVGLLEAFRPGVLQFPTESGALYFYSLFGSIAQGVSLLMPFLYGFAIFLLYRHLAEWVTLESELV